MPVAATEWRHTCRACGWAFAQQGDCFVQIERCPTCGSEEVQRSSRRLMAFPGQPSSPSSPSGSGALGDFVRRVLGR